MFISRNGSTNGTYAARDDAALGSQPLRRLDFAPELVIPLRQHLGTEARPLVREGQEVVRGEPIAEPVEFLSVGLHAPATGVIDRIDDYRTADGQVEQAIYLRVYPGASQEVLYGAAVDVDAMAPAEIIRAIQAAGIVGLGGVPFPTHAMLDLPEDKSVDSLVVSALEAAPHLGVAQRALFERQRELIAGLRYVLRASQAERAVVVLDARHAPAIEALKKEWSNGSPVSVLPANQAYPLGAERRLVKDALGRDVPEGGLPIDAHAALFSVATLAAVGELLPMRRGVIEQIVTFSGPGVARPGNYLVPVGTPLPFALDQVGARPSAAEVLIGAAGETLDAAARTIPLTKGIIGVRVTENGMDHRAAGQQRDAGRRGQAAR